MGEVQNGQVTITYTVYNEQAGTETGVLLTTTLQPGVTLLNSSVTLDGNTATQLPDQNGQNLAWSLQPIQGYDRESVAVTVSLPSSSTLQLDSGAHAYAMLDAGALTASTPAAALRSGNVADPALLASTPDANSNDPYVQEEAAKLNYDPTQIFNFLHSDIGYNSYTGSVRGARGTLWSSAGNALDVASLGVALMRTSGIPAQYASGTLSYQQAQTLILSMYPASYQTVGYIPSGTQTADPANDATLQSETQSHYWFQFDPGSGMTNADPLMSTATIGQTFTTATGTFSEVPPSLRATTEVKLSAEIYSQASALFGVGDGLTTTTVLDQTFNDVALVGHPLSFGNLVNSQGFGAIFTEVTNTYTPYVQIGDNANPNPNQDTTILGTPYQEVLTNFPLGSEVLTGEFLNVVLSGPGQTTQSFEHTILDLLGPAVRQGGAAPALSINPSGPPSLTEFDITTLNALPGLQSPRTLAPLQAVIASEYQSTSQLIQPDGTFGGTADSSLRNFYVSYTRLVAAQFLISSDASTAQLAATSGVAAYADSPRLIVSSTKYYSDSSAGTGLTTAIDLLRDTLRVVVAPGDNTQALQIFNFVRGVMETQLEGTIVSQFGSALGGTATNLSAGVVLSAAHAQGIPLVSITAMNLTLLGTLPISANAKALITQEVMSGSTVLVPATSVATSAGPQIAWYQVNPTTGETIGVGENGSHPGIEENVALKWIITGFLLGFVASRIWPKHPPLPQIPVTIFTGLGAVGAAFFIYLATAAFLPLLVLEVGIIIYLLASKSDPTAAGLLTSLLQSPQAQPSLAAAQAQVASGVNSSSGSVAGSLQTKSLAASGPLNARWTTSSNTSLFASSLTASSAKVLDASGKTIGSGSVSFQSAQAVPAIVGGSVSYQVTGNGSLSFDGPAGSGLGVSGDWQSYSAQVSGSAAIELIGGSLVLNGQPLPAGTYTITTGQATIAGSGTSTSPSFSGTVSLSSNGDTINIEASGGSFSVGGKPLETDDEATLDQYTGTINVSAGAGGSQSVSLSGSAGNVLQVTTSTATFTTDQNTPITFAPSIHGSLADTYTLTANAPSGWTVTIDSKGNVTAAPAPGLQGGTYPIQIIAQSQSDPNLVAQATVEVTIKPTTPGMSLGVASDSVLSVPFDGADLPTGFRASIQNLGPAPDTYNLSFSNVPAGFSVQTSTSSVTVPAGQTGIVGVYLVPNPGQPLPAPGTQLSFTVTATSKTTSSITKAQNVTFTVPAIDAVTVTASPSSVNTTPGVAASDTLTITNVGNVPQTNISFASSNSAGLSVSGLAPLSLAVGQSTTETVTFTPSASTPLNSILQSTITATYGPTTSPQTQTLNMTVDVVVPGAAALANAAVAAQQLSNSGLAGRLQDLSTALTSLVQNPTSPVYQGQALANLDSLISQLTNDPFLSGFTSGLTTARTALASASTASAVQSAVSGLGTALGSLAQVISDDAAHQFTISLSPDRNIVQPAAPEVFDILITNNGTAATTYDLGISGLPAGVSSAFSQPSVTLQPGQSLTAGNSAVTLTLTESGGTLIPANFTIAATAEGASEITQGTPGFLTLRDSSIIATGIVTNPAYVSPGGKVDVSAQILGTVNQATPISAYYTVTDQAGSTLFTSTAVPVSLAVNSGLVTADLGNLDTTGFAPGVDSISVTLLDGSSKPIPGGSTSTSYLIGQPVTATLSTTPATVPTGSDTVTTTLSATTLSTYPSPLTLQGALATPAPGTSVALYTSGGKTYAYESGTGGINAIDVTNAASPQLLETFGQNEITNGKFGFNVARVVGNELLVGTSNGNNGSVFNLLVYSLASPASPTLVSNTTINYRFLSDLLVNSTGTAVFVPTNGFMYFGSTIFQDFGDFVAIDLTDPTQPVLASALFTNQGQPNGGNMNQFGGVLVNDQIAYSAGLAPGGSTIIGNTGNLLVVNISDPKNMSLITQLKIPGTINILNVATYGNRALVVGTAGTESNIYNPNATGVANHLTLTVLDITDPSNPQILGSTFVTNEQFPLGEAGAKTDVVSLGNGDFAISDTDQGGNPALLVVDPSNPGNIVVSAAQVPSGVHGITVAGNLLYATTSSGLSIYQIGQLVSDPVTFSVNLPPGTAANIPASSFNIAPTQITSGTTADTLTWDRSFSAGDTTFTFSWQSSISGVQAGQTTAVTQGSTIAYVAQGSPGSLTLPGTAVTGTPIIRLITTSATEQPGGSATYDVRLYNPTSATVTYSLSGPDLPSGVNGNFTSVTVPADSSVDTPLVLHSGTYAQPGTYPFSVTADYLLYSSDGVTQLGEFKGSASSSLVIAGPPVVTPDSSAHGVVVTISPTRAVAGQGTSATYVVQLTNVGSLDDQFSLEINGLPQGVYGSFGQNAYSLDVPPGASNARDVSLTITTSAGTVPGDIPFTVRAASESSAGTQGTAQATLSVVFERGLAGPQPPVDHARRQPSTRRHEHGNADRHFQPGPGRPGSPGGKAGDIHRHSGAGCLADGSDHHHGGRFRRRRSVAADGDSHLASESRRHAGSHVRPGCSIFHGHDGAVHSCVGDGQGTWNHGPGS